MVLVEAMAHGVPVAAIDRGATREILSNGTYGTLVMSSSSEGRFRQRLIFLPPGRSLERS
jgi:glycosyltransferase involved in cell wall biosynthesis